MSVSFGPASLACEGRQYRAAVDFQAAGPAFEGLQLVVYRDDAHAPGKPHGYAALGQVGNR